MKCHYEVLDVPKDADDTQIKTSYRKLALKWHPDKNLDNAEIAKTEFQLVQQAYEILGDRQERAWYDKHREQILFGNNTEFKGSDLNIFKYFTASCYKGYSDDQNGFYTIYRKVFEEIVQDDIEHMMDKEDLLEVPTFGTSTSDYEDVVGPFYDYWLSYSTKKSFVWLDQYNIQEVQRRVLKLIEKEHKKIRQKAKKEWNDEVRALVAFVRKRDRRVKEYTKIREAKILENRQRNEELSKQKRLERKKLLNDSHNLEAEWTKFDNVKNELEQIEKTLAEEFGEQISEDEDDIENEDQELTNLYCVACNKMFKSPKAFENHESSKKHKENVAKLKDTMEEVCSESEFSIASAESILSELEDIISEDDLTDSTAKTVQKLIKLKKKQKRCKIITRESISEDDNAFLRTEDLKDDFQFDNSSKKNRNKKSKANAQTPRSADLLTEGHKSSIENNEINGEANSASTKGTHNKKQPKEICYEQPNVDSNHCCVTCNSNFQSKNKLFNHLKKTGHSVLKPQSANSRGVKNKRLDK